MKSYLENEIKLYNLLFLLVGIGQALYVFFIHLNNNWILNKESKFVAIIFLIFCIGIYFYNKKIKKSFEYYETLMMFTLMILGGLNIYYVFIYDFLIDYVLGVQIILFGGILLFNSINRIIIYCSFYLVFYISFVIYFDKINSTTISILFAYLNIFFYSFYVQNGNLKNRKILENTNLNLEELVSQRTKEIELALQSLEEKNEKLNDYAHAVSHDLKAPIRNINALVNWVKDDNEKIIDVSSKESLDLVLFNLEKMDNLIKGILDYSTIDKVETMSSWINLNEVIDEILKSILIPSHFKINVANNLPKIFGNTHKIKQIFQNLIQNAINYNNNENPFVEIKYTEDENNHLFTIKDNGIGIKMVHQDKIFQTFTKLHENSQSSGLGLSIVKRIVETLDGKIWLESEINIGTTFFFTLPQNTPHGNT
jgi:signal transduction histidine kinase